MRRAPLLAVLALAACGGGHAKAPHVAAGTRAAPAAPVVRKPAAVARLRPVPAECSTRPCRTRRRRGFGGGAVLLGGLTVSGRLDRLGRPATRAGPRRVGRAARRAARRGGRPPRQHHLPLRRRRRRRASSTRSCGSTRAPAPRTGRAPARAELRPGRRRDRRHRLRRRRLHRHALARHDRRLAAGRRARASSPTCRTRSATPPSPLRADARDRRRLARRRHRERRRARVRARRRGACAGSAACPRRRRTPPPRRSAPSPT